MQKEKIYRWTLIFFILTWLPISQAQADGGYVSVSISQSVAISADQRAIIIKEGKEISMTFSTGYTGEGEDFGWIIPTPVPPATEDVSEAGENGENAFKFLDELTAPIFFSEGGGGGCFPSGTEVLTTTGPHPIETVETGTKVYACDLATGEWMLARVLRRQSHQYNGDMIAIQMGQITIHATGNHPFYVLNGDRLASRPLPQDVPKEEQLMSANGRWVEARDLKEGDVLKDKSGEGLIISSLASRHEKTEVYNLTVEGYHNYAVHQKGILVHNKGGAEAAAAPEPLVTVYGTVTLKHYEVSILGAAAASALLDWLQENDYQVNRAAEEVLDTYVDRNWAFVAVKLNPSEKRHYENEFLPPLTIKYQYDQLIFPLHISSISTTQTVRITLYVIAESTVYSSNFPTRTLRYNRRVGDPQSYVEACIQETIGSEDRALVVMWSQEFFIGGHIINELMKNPLSEVKKIYLTRLETRLDSESMTEDIRFVLDYQPKYFQVQF